MVLEPAQRLNYALAFGRGAWMHVVDGDVTVDGMVLRTGDGAGAGAGGGRGVNITARMQSELLLIDVV